MQDQQQDSQAVDDSVPQESIFNDDSQEMRTELKANLESMSYQNMKAPSQDFQNNFDFILKCMDVLGFDDEQKKAKMQEFYMGIEAIAFERLVEMMDDATKQKVSSFMQDADPNTVDPHAVAELQNELRSQTDNSKVFQAYFSAIMAIVDLYTTDFLEQANEEQKDQIRKILLEQQEKIEQMTVNVVPKEAIVKENN